MTRTVIIVQPFERALATLDDAVTRLSEDGSAFVIFSNEYNDKGSVVHSFSELIVRAEMLGYTYVSTFVYPTVDTQSVAFEDNVRYIIWLCRSIARVSVDRDALGARLERYSGSGKRLGSRCDIRHCDPGSVWIPLDGDGRASDSKHIMLSEREVIDCLRVLSGCHEDYELYVESVSPAEIKNTHRVDETGRTSAILMAEDLSENEPSRRRIRESLDSVGERGSLWVIADGSDSSAISDIDRIISICGEYGAFYKGALIWHMPSNIVAAGNRLSTRHKYLMIFSRNEDFCVDRTVSESFCDYRNARISGKAFWRISAKNDRAGNCITERIKCVTQTRPETVTHKNQTESKV
jgi:hypothetical protein